MSPTRKEKFLCYTCLELFLALSSVFKLTMTCYWFFHFLRATTSQKVLTYEFTLNQLLKRSASVIVKQDRFFELQSETKWYYKVGQVLKRRRIFITKLGKFYYKLGQQLQSSAVQKANERNRENRFLQPISSFNPNLPDICCTYRNYWDVEILL